MFMNTKKTLPAHILVVEDDESLSYFLRKTLEQQSLKVDSASDGEKGLKMATIHKYDLLILDIGLPSLNGLQIVKRLRGKDIKTPIIMITNDASSFNEKETFNLGANLFHRKPIDFDLLIVQIRSILSMNSVDPTFKIGDLFIDVKKRFVTKAEKDLHLSFKEFELLLALISVQGDVLSRPELINQTMKGIRDVEEGSIDTLVSRVRKKIGKFEGEDIIETIHGVGFRLNLNYLNQKA